MESLTTNFSNIFGFKPPSQIVFDECLIGGSTKKCKSTKKVFSPIYNGESKERIIIGSIGINTEEDAIEAVKAAHKAYAQGRGEWPQMPTGERIERVNKFVQGLKEQKEQIVQLLMWEICKNRIDSEKEVDRTIKYIHDTIVELKRLENSQSMLVSDSGISALIKRTPLGVALCVAPFNYPLNETYTTLIPALLMGNTIVLKVPSTGCLCHQPTVSLFKECFPPGVVNIIMGSGRELLPPIMKSGLIDVFAFIGTSKVARSLQMNHPATHRLRVVLGLDAKNSAVLLPDADMSVTISECILGTLSFNGQRCTAIKIIFVHESIADEFVEKFSKAVDELKMGLPWDKDVQITPLAEENKPTYLKEVIHDALSKGAKIVNSRIGMDRSLVAPTVLYPVNRDMRIYHEEQFGPVVPIVPYKDIEEYYSFLLNSHYGQQASVFSTGQSKETKLQLANVIDVLVQNVSRVNINAQCQRSPDSFPFTGRKDSAFSTLSVFDALRAMSIRSVVAVKEKEENLELISNLMISRKSKFVRSTYLI